MPVTADKPGPYAPASAILEIVLRYRNRGLQAPINADVIGRAGISDSLIPRTIQALHTLDLVDESGMPTPAMESIRRAAEGDVKKRMQEWLKGAYADVFSFVDPMVDDETRVRDAFRNYNPVGQQGRMVALFMGLCTAAEMTPEKPIKAAAPQQRGSVTLRGTGKMTATARTNPKPPARFYGGGPAYPVNMPPAVAGLLASLPDPNLGWTAAERDKFLKAFTAMLDFSFPIRKADEKENADQN